MRKSTDRDVPQGELHRLAHNSEVLTGNLLGDPTDRELHVYTPAGWNPNTPLPLLVDLVGFTAGGPAHTNWKAFGENVPERLDRLIAAGEMPPVVVAFPDCFTRLGGNQYVNSTAMGRYADYVIEEIVPTVEAQFSCGGTGRRGVFGKSSGGFGSLWHGMKHSDFWAALACSAGDSAFEAVYLPDVYGALRALQKHDMSVEKFLTHLEAGTSPKSTDIKCLMICAMAASYDPDPKSYLGIRLPVDLQTAELIPERWANWLAHDPALIVADHKVALGHLKGIWLDCGTQDEFNIQFGMRRVSAALKAADIAHVHEEFEGGHFDIDYRQDRFLPWMAKLLSA